MADTIEGNHLDPYRLLPAKPGTCPECAADHKSSEPHNQQSLYYQYHFYNEHGRWPTWGDAIAHCDDAIKSFWKRELLKHDVAENEFEVVED
jgi:hypothetical protein